MRLKHEAGRKRSLHKAWVGVLFVLPAVLYFLFVYTYPFLETIKLSFFKTRNGVETFAGIKNYVSRSQAAIMKQQGSMARHRSRCFLRSRCRF